MSSRLEFANGIRSRMWIDDGPDALIAIQSSHDVLLYRTVSLELDRLEDFSYEFSGEFTQMRASDICEMEERDMLRGTHLGYWIARSNGGIAGLVGLTGSVINPEAPWDLGYWVIRGQEGTGIAYRGVKTAVDYAFTELGISGITATIRPENRRSKRLVERLGAKPDPAPDGVSPVKWRLANVQTS